MKTNNIYIVNHTHWDREWYRSYNDYAASLKRGVIHLLSQLDNGLIDNFFFDGQTIIIEDLAEILPKSYFEKFINYIKEGKIEVGPWYVLPDEGLIDFTGYQKNIELGASICKKYGLPNGKVMYLPDTFGHDASIPKLAKEYDLEHAIIHRGVTCDQIDVTWVKDDYRLKSLVLPTREGYYQTMFHHDDYLQKLEAYISAYTARTSSSDILILNGCDHTFPSDMFNQRLEDFKSKNPNYEVKQVTLTEFFKHANYSFDQQISGELRDSGIAFLLPGVLSTRQYLKVQNRMLVDLVKDKYEPIAKLLGQLELEEMNILRLWKLIIQNHPHDSICGCSIDEVHREMEVRSQSVLDSSMASIKELFNSKYYYDMTHDIFNNKLLVYNHTQTKKFDTTITLYLPHEIETDGKQVVFQAQVKQFVGEIISSEKIEKLVHDYKHELYYQFLKETVVATSLEINPNTIGEFTISLKDEDSKQLFNYDYDQFIKNNLNYRFITDRGDSYNFDPVGDYEQFNTSLVAEESYAHYHQLIFKSVANVSVDYDFEAQVRCGEVKPLVITTEIKFYPGGYAKVKASIINEHKNIKVVNSISNKQNEEVVSDTALYLEKREMLNNITYVAPENNTEVDYNQKPTQTMFTVGDNLSVYHIGQNELEVLEGEVLTTLFRAVGDLSRRDMISRKGGAGPSIATPECQCARKLEFNYLYNYGRLNITHTNLYETTLHQYRGNDENECIK